MLKPPRATNCRQGNLNKRTPGATKLGSCLTYATRESRPRSAVRVFPLCYRPSVCDSNHRGVLTRWHHIKPPCLACKRYLRTPQGYSQDWLARGGTKRDVNQDLKWALERCAQNRVCRRRPAAKMSSFVALKGIIHCKSAVRRSQGVTARL